MEINPNLLWSKDNVTYAVAYPKRVFDIDNLGENNATQLAVQAARLFDYHKGLRITGALGIYSQISGAGRRLSDIDVLVDESSFREVISLAQNKGYAFCRLSQRELKDGTRKCIFEEVSTDDFLVRKPSVRAVLLRKDRAQSHEQLCAKDLIDIFVGYVDKEGWERTYDHMRLKMQLFK